jgi:acetyltransferase-like isoleucine patch superfamily enzyme
LLRVAIFSLGFERQVGQLIAFMILDRIFMISLKSFLSLFRYTIPIEHKRERGMARMILSRVLHKMAMIVPGGSTIRPFLHRKRGVRIGEKVWISQYVYIDEIHPEAVFIGDHSSIGLRTSIIAHLYWGSRRSTEHAGPVRIGNNVFIGPHCVILPNVTIGDGAVIMAGSVVSQHVPTGVVWGTPKAGPIATATVPLTHNTSYRAFSRGLRPFKPSRPVVKKKGNEILKHTCDETHSVAHSERLAR